jgi:hypothetical protein
MMAGKPVKKDFSRAGNPGLRSGNTRGATRSAARKSELLLAGGPGSRTVKNKKKLVLKILQKQRNLSQPSLARVPSDLSFERSEREQRRMYKERGVYEKLHT